MPQFMSNSKTNIYKQGNAFQSEEYTRTKSSSNLHSQSVIMNDGDATVQPSTSAASEPDSSHVSVTNLKKSNIKIILKTLVIVPFVEQS